MALNTCYKKTLTTMLNLGYLINTAQQFLLQINIHIKLKKLVILNSHFAYSSPSFPSPSPATQQ